MLKINNIRYRFNDLKNKKVPPQQIAEIRRGLEESSLSITYLVLILGSCVIATFGLLSNSAAVIIGAMIIAPLMLPIRGVAFGALEGNVILFRKGLTAILVGTLLAIALAVFISYLVSFPVFGSEIISRSKPTLLDLGIAITAGGIGFFTFPLILLTFGLFLFVLNAVIFGLAAAIVPGFRLRYGIWSALIGAIALSVINSLIFNLLVAHRL